jgi:hypothetical protein
MVGRGRLLVRGVPPPLVQYSFVIPTLFCVEVFMVHTYRIFAVEDINIYFSFRGNDYHINEFPQYQYFILGLLLYINEHTNTKRMIHVYSVYCLYMLSVCKYSFKWKHYHSKMSSLPLNEFHNLYMMPP